MKNKVELIVSKDGHIEGIYQDGLAKKLGANTEDVRRASNVEWEDLGEGLRGWTVRAAHDPSLAIRLDAATQQLIVSRKNIDQIFYFSLRETALEEEVKCFWLLLERSVPNSDEVRNKFVKDYEHNPCPDHGVTGCMWCRYGEGKEPPRVM